MRINFLESLQSNMLHAVLRFFARGALLTAVLCLCNSLAASETERFPLPIPSDYGAVLELNGEQGTRFVYHIQDAHCQPDAQYNIANLINAVLSHHGSAVVGIEGASGEIDARTFQAYPDKQALNKVSRYFVNKGTISGAEYLYITRDKPFVLTGVENAGQYRQDYDLLAKSLPACAHAVEAITEFQRIIGDYALQNVSDRQRVFLERWAQYYTHGITLDAYCSYLCEALSSATFEDDYPALASLLDVVKKEQAIDINAVEQQRLAFLDHVSTHADKHAVTEIFQYDIRYKLKKVSRSDYFSALGGWIREYAADTSGYEAVLDYIELLRQSSSLTKSDISRELAQAEQACAAGLFTDAAGVEIYNLYRASYYYRDLFAFTIQAPVLAELNTTLSIPWMKDSARKLVSDSYADINWDVISRQAEDARVFYQVARQREESMVNNLLAAMEKENVRVGVLVTGGFHQQGVRDELNARNIRYCAVEPVLREVVDDNRYFSLIQQWRSPFERWIQGSTIALASWLASQPLADTDIRPVRAQIFSSMLIASSVRDMSVYDTVRLTDNFGEVVTRAQEILEPWRIRNAPSLELAGVELIANKLAVTIKVNKRPVIFLFTSRAGDQLEYIEGTEALETGSVGPDTVTAVTADAARRISELARINERVQSGTQQEDVMLEFISHLGLNPSGTLTMRNFLDRLGVYQPRTGTGFDLAVAYDALGHVIANSPKPVRKPQQLNLFDNPQDIARAIPVDPSTLIPDTFQLLRRAYNGETIVERETLNPQWQEQFESRNISAVVIDPTMPFEALVMMMAEILFRSVGDADLYPLGMYDGKMYRLRSVKLLDNSLFVRVMPEFQTGAVDALVAVSPELTQFKIPGLPFGNGVLTLEKDGGFVLASVKLIGPDKAKLEETGISQSIDSIAEGPKGAEQLDSFLAGVRAKALDSGILIRGIVYRDQNGEPLFFEHHDDFLAQYDADHSKPYIPLRQSDWAKTAGSMSNNQVSRMVGNNNVRPADIVSGHEVFRPISRHMDINGKRFLDLGTQSGQYVFYAYYKGASFSVGLDFNPYNIRIAREISAYLHENEKTEGDIAAGTTGAYAVSDRLRSRPEFQGDIPGDTIEKYATAPLGNISGQILARTQLLKRMEKNSQRVIASTPPENLEFLIGDARSVPYADSTFDFVNSMYLLQFIDGASTAVKEMLRVTRPGGFIQFNYFMKAKEQRELLEEAVRLLSVEQGVQVSYEIVEQLSVTDPELDGVLIRITDKKSVPTIEQDKDFVLKHSRKRNYLHNLFDEAPYLDTVNGGTANVPEAVMVVEKAPLSEYETLTSLTSVQKAHLAFVMDLMRKIFGEKAFDGIHTISIERGAFVMMHGDRGTLRFQPLALRNPLIMFVSAYLQVYTHKADAIKDSTFAQRDIFFDAHYDSFARVAGLYDTLQLLNANLSPDQSSQLIQALKGQYTRDTTREREAFALAELIDATPKVFLDEQLVDVILEELQFLSGAGKTSLLPSGSGYTLYDVVETLSGSATQSIEFSLYFDHLLSDPLLSVPYTGTIDTGVQLWTDFLRRYYSLTQANIPLPDNFKALLAEDSIRQILHHYPRAGFYVLNDMIRSILDNPVNVPRAPFLLDLSSRDILQVVQNIEISLGDSSIPDSAGTLDRIFSDAQTASRQFPSRFLKPYLLSASPLEALQVVLDGKISLPEIDVIVANREWKGFLPYLEKIRAYTGGIPAQAQSMFSDTVIDQIMNVYPATGFYVLSDLARAILKNENDPAEVPYLIDMSDDQLIKIIAGLDEFIRKVEHDSIILRQGISEAANLPGTYWIGPKMHQAFLELNGGKPYRHIDINASIGIETVEQAEELYALFREITEDMRIAPDEFVVLKLFDAEEKEDEGTFGTLIVVADTFANINSRMELIRLRTMRGDQLGQNPFSFKMHFYYDDFEMGDIVGEDWHIAFGSEDLKNRGLGSEFFRNHFSILHTFGMSSRLVRSTVRGIPMLTLLDSGLKSEFIESLIDEAPTKIASRVNDYASLMYRLGIFDDSTYQYVIDHFEEKDLLAERISEALSSAKRADETYVQLFLRTAHDVVENSKRLDRYIPFFEAVLFDPAVRAAYPEIRADNPLIAQYLEARTSEQFLLEPVSLRLEKQLFGQLDDIAAGVDGYFRNDTRGLLAQYMPLLNARDQSHIIQEFNDFFENGFSYVRLHGRIPREIPEQEIGYSARMILRRAQETAPEFGRARTVDALTSEDPLRALDGMRYELRRRNGIRAQLHRLAVEISRDQSSGWIDYYFGKVAESMAEYGIPLSKAYRNSTEFYSDVIDNPKGGWRLFSYINTIYMFDADSGKKYLRKIKALPRTDFVSLLQMLGQLPGQKAEEAFDTLLAVAGTGLPSKLDAWREDGSMLGRFALLSHAENVIMPSDDMENFVIRADFQASESLQGRGYSDMAQVIYDSLNRRGFSPQPVRFTLPSVSGSRYGIQLNNLVFSSTSEGRLRVDLYDQVDADKISISELQAVTAEISLSDQPLMRHDIDDANALQFHGGIDLVTDTTVQFYIVSTHFKSNVPRAVHSVTVQAPVWRLYDLAQSVYLSFPEDMAAILNLVPEVEFAVMSEPAESEFLNLQANGIAAILKVFFTQFDPEWVASGKRNHIVGTMSTLSPEEVMQNLSFESYADTTVLMRQVLEQMQKKVLYPDQPLEWIFQQNEQVKPTVITVDGLPAGWFNADNTVSIDPAIPAEQARLIRDYAGSKRDGRETQNTDKPGLNTVVPVVSMRLDEYLQWDTQWYDGFSDTVIGIDKYIRALNDMVVFWPAVSQLVAKKHEIRIVEGYWKAGDLLYSATDGSKVIILDIDTFRSPALLAFTLSHAAVLPESANEAGAFAGEVQALVRDILFFERLTPAEQSELVSMLRDVSVNTQKYADFLENGLNQSLKERFISAVDMAANADIYPQYSGFAAPMDRETLYRQVAAHINQDLADRMHAAGLDWADTAAVLAGVDSRALASIVRVLDNQGNPDMFAQFVLMTAGKGQLELSQLIEAYYSPENVKALFRSDEMGSALEQWAYLFAQYGPEVIPEMIKAAYGDIVKDNLFLSISPGLEKAFNKRVHVSEPPMGEETSLDERVISVFIEEGDSIITRKYSIKGELIGETSHKIIPYTEAVQYLVRKYSEECQQVYGEPFAVIIDELEAMSANPPDLLKARETMSGILKRLQSLGEHYNKMRNEVDLSQIQLSKRNEIENIIKQFLSDLIGSPLAAAFGFTQLVSQGLEEDGSSDQVAQAVRWNEKILSSLLRMQENMVRFQMIQDIYIAPRPPGMIIFDQTLEQAENRVFTENPFSSNRDIMDAITQKIEKAEQGEVFVVYFEGTDTQSLQWLWLIQQQIDERPSVRLAVVAPQYVSAAFTEVLESIGISTKNIVIFGQEVLAQVQPNTETPLNPADVARLTSLNLDVPVNNIVFMTADKASFAAIARSGLQVVPLPEIQNVPKPVKRNFVPVDLLENAA
jgi:SAM-dependent methyltransferase